MGVLSSSPFGYIDILTAGCGLGAPWICPIPLFREHIRLLSFIFHKNSIRPGLLNSITPFMRKYGQESHGKMPPHLALFSFLLFAQKANAKINKINIAITFRTKLTFSIASCFWRRYIRIYYNCFACIYIYGRRERRILCFIYCQFSLSTAAITSPFTAYVFKTML